MGFFSTKKLRNILMLIQEYLIIVEIFLGFYIGVWIFFIGGIVQIVEGIKPSPVVPWNILEGILRMVLALIAGVVSALLLIFPGWQMFSAQPKIKK